MKKTQQYQVKPSALVLSAAVLATMGAARAEDAKPGDGPVVTVSAAVGARQDANASKQIIGADEIARFGDSNLIGILSRIPGITVSGGASQGSEIRMRGLGNGYTQFLVNGEKVATGFSIDSISPDLIERIEIVRSATADESTQSIAGAVNIILKKSVRPGQTDLKASLSRYQGLVSENVSGQYGGSDGAMSYSLTANLKHEEDLWPSQTEQRESDGGVVRYVRSTVTTGRREQNTFSLTPRLAWKLEREGTLNIDALLQGQRFNMRELNTRYTIFGTAPTFGSDALNISNDSWQARLTEGYKSRVGDKGRIEQKLVLDFNRRTADGLRRFFSDRDTSQVGLDRQVTSLLVDRGATLTGKYVSEIAQGHTFAFGWNGQYTERGEDRNQVETSPIAYPTSSFKQDYDATIKRIAVFAQDEWAPYPSVSAYMGIRWEGLRTDTAGVDLAAIRNSSSVFSPTMQMIWKIPETKSDQLRVSLGRTYKAPTAKDLIPRLWQVADVTPTSPNFRGNPDLRPELSWGLDVGYERYLSGNGFVGLNIYLRRIDNVILQQLFRENGMWINTPVNSGSAQVAGLELEVKGKLRSLIEEAPDVDVRLGLNANRSRVDSVQGANNRLNQQVPFSSSIGLDYRPAGISWVFGANHTFERGTYTQVSATQSSVSINRRSTDVYGLWNIDKKNRLRLTYSRAMGADDGLSSRYFDGVLDQYQRITAASVNTVRALFETSF